MNLNTHTTKPARATWMGDLARKHSVSESAVEVLYAALQRGGGGMAQFSHPDLGGTGQWMRNGMIMVGDMFNQALKSKVDALCHALLPYINEGSGVESAAQLKRSERAIRNRDDQPRESSHWWPAEYASPAATGGQDNFRYAYFPNADTLVVEQNGRTVVYDTSGHDLRGFGQQQTSTSGFSLRSAHGLVDLSKLPQKKSLPRK